MPIARIEWPSGLSIQDILVGAGRVERQINANGDPTYVGYAPRADSRTDAEGWLIEYYIYDGSNKLLTIKRQSGLSWDGRTGILSLVRAKDIPPAVGTMQIVGIRAQAVQHRHSTAFGSTVKIVQGSITTKRVKFAAKAFAQIKVIQKTVQPNGLNRGIAVGTIRINALVATVSSINRGKAFAQIKFLSLANANKI